jgi:glutathione S-transferase
MQLYIANKAYSSWSQRPWLVLTHFGIPFEEVQAPLYTDAFRSTVLPVSPTGKVPALVDGGITVWESIAIIEYLAEKYPDRGIWPADRAARAQARAIAAEMYGGFQALRSAYTCNFRRVYAWKERGGPQALADGKRIQDLWRGARAKFGAGGPFLFGSFSAADAMYAPVVSRFHTYSWPLEPDVAAYAKAVRELPAYRAWQAAANAEPWVIDTYEYVE